MDNSRRGDAPSALGLRRLLSDLLPALSLALNASSFSSGGDEESAYLRCAAQWRVYLTGTLLARPG
jgi:hypothetical protein